MIPYWASIDLPPLKKTYTPEFFDLPIDESSVAVRSKKIESLRDELAIEILLEYYSFTDIVVFYRPPPCNFSFPYKEAFFKDDIKYHTSSSVSIQLMGKSYVSFQNIPETEFKFTRRYEDGGAVDIYRDGQYEEITRWEGDGWVLLNPSFCHKVEYSSLPRLVLSLRNRDITWEDAVHTMQHIIK